MGFALIRQDNLIISAGAEIMKNEAVGRRPETFIGKPWVTMQT